LWQIVKWASGPALATLHEKHAWEYLVALAGAFNMLLLILANLAIMHGFQGSADFLRRIFLAPGQVVYLSLSVHSKGFK